MKTDDLIAHLGQDRSPNNSVAPATAMMVAAAAALVFALIISVAWLRPRPDLMASLMAENHVFLLKVAFTLGVVFAALPIIRDLSIPGRRLGAWSVLAAVPFLIIGLLALQESSALQRSGLSHHGDVMSSLECLWQIPVLSIPALVILAIAVRNFAPTNLTLTGAYIGLAAGGIGAVGYSFHCDHDSFVFIAVFYTLAIFEMTIMGALFGPRVLRWTIAR